MWSLGFLSPKSQRSFLGDTILELAATPRLRSSNSDNWGLTTPQDIPRTHHAEHQCEVTCVEVAIITCARSCKACGKNFLTIGEAAVPAARMKHCRRCETFNPRGLRISCGKEMRAPSRIQAFISSSPSAEAVGSVEGSNLR